MTSSPPAGETAEERRARKAAAKAANLERVTREVDAMLKPIPDSLGFNELAMEHTRLRQKIMEIQQLAITGQFDFAKAQDFERILVEQIHKVEERAHAAQSGGRHVPRPGT